MRKKRKLFITEIQVIKNLFMKRETQRQMTLMDKIVINPNEKEERTKR